MREIAVQEGIPHHNVGTLCGTSVAASVEHDTNSAIRMAAAYAVAPVRNVYQHLDNGIAELQHSRGKRTGSRWIRTTDTVEITPGSWVRPSALLSAAHQSGLVRVG